MERIGWWFGAACLSCVLFLTGCSSAEENSSSAQPLDEAPSIASASGGAAQREGNLPERPRVEPPQINDPAQLASEVFQLKVRAAFEDALREMNAAVIQEGQAFTREMGRAEGRTVELARQIGVDDGLIMRRENSFMGIRHGRRVWTDENQRTLEARISEVLYEGEDPFETAAQHAAAIREHLEEFERQVFDATFDAIIEARPTLNPERIASLDRETYLAQIRESNHLFVDYLLDTQEEYLRHEGAFSSSGAYADLAEAIRSPLSQERARRGARTHVARSAGTVVGIAAMPLLFIAPPVVAALRGSSIGARVAPTLFATSDVMEIAADVSDCGRRCDDERTRLASLLQDRVSLNNDRIRAGMFSALLCSGLDPEAGLSCQFDSAALSQAFVVQRTALVAEAASRTLLHQMIAEADEVRSACWERPGASVETCGY